VDLFRFTKDMFGREMLVGVNWELLWLPVSAAAVVILAHLLICAIRRKS